MIVKPKTNPPKPFGLVQQYMPHWCATTEMHMQSGDRCSTPLEQRCRQWSLKSSMPSSACRNNSRLSDINSEFVCSACLLAFDVTCTHALYFVLGVNCCSLTCRILLVTGTSCKFASNRGGVVLQRRNLSLDLSNESFAFARFQLGHKQCLCGFCLFYNLIGFLQQFPLLHGFGLGPQPRLLFLFNLFAFPM